MEPERLFVEIDHTEDVLARASEFDPYWDLVAGLTGQIETPEPTLRFECRKCQRLKECVGQGIDNHVFDIPRLSHSKFESLAAMGVYSIEDIPEGFALTVNQRRVSNCVKTGNVFVGDALRDELEAIVWPAFYLDFETVMTAIPLYPDIAPYVQIPTQYSIHKCTSVRVITGHRDYLAEPSKDCRRELAEHLVEDLQGDGSIIVYSNFENRVVNDLKILFNDLSAELDALAARMVDLQAIIRRNFYHPAFHGSLEEKTTLPVLVPDMSYDHLEIADGDSAMAAFAYLALGEYSAVEMETVKRNLLEYCKHDTLGLVRMHEELARHVGLRGQH